MKLSSLFHATYARPPAGGVNCEVNCLCENKKFIQAAGGFTVI